MPAIPRAKVRMIRGPGTGSVRRGPRAVAASLLTALSMTKCFSSSEHFGSPMIEIFDVTVTGSVGDRTAEGTLLAGGRHRQCWLSRWSVRNMRLRVATA